MAGKDGVPVDRGWAWVVAAACTLETFLIFGTIKSFGILFVEFTEAYNTKAATISLVLSVKTITFSITCPIVMSIGLLYVPARALIMAGSILHCLSYLITGFAPNVEILFLTLGIFWGLSEGLIHGPVLVTLGNYFSKRKGLANTIANTGSSLGGLTLSPLYRFLLDRYNLRGALLIISGVNLHLLITCCLLRPVSFYLKKKTRIMEVAPQSTENVLMKCPKGENKNIECDEMLDTENLLSETNNREYRSQYKEGDCNDIIDTQGVDDKVELQEVDNINRTDTQEVDSNDKMDKQEADNNDKSDTPELDYDKIDKKEVKDNDKCNTQEVDYNDKIDTDEVDDNDKIDTQEVDDNDKIDTQEVDDNDKTDTQEVALEKCTREYYAHYDADLEINEDCTFLPTEKQIKSDKHMYGELNRQKEHSNSSSSDTSNKQVVFESNVLSREIRKSTLELESGKTNFRNMLKRTLLNLFDKELFTNKLFLMFSLSTLLGVFGCGMLLTFIPPFAKDLNIVEVKIPLLITIASSLDLAGRVFVACFADSGIIKRQHIIAIAFIITGIACNLSRYFVEFWSLSVFVSIYGFFGGMYFCLFPVVLLDFVGMEKLSVALGINLLMHGASYAIAVPILGFIRDCTGSYVGSFHFFGVCQLLAGVTLLLEPLTRK